jgi:hypothetical protein
MLVYTSISESDWFVCYLGSKADPSFHRIASIGRIEPYPALPWELQPIVFFRVKLSRQNCFVRLSARCRIKIDRAHCLTRRFEILARRAPVILIRLREKGAGLAGGKSARSACTVEW